MNEWIRKLPAGGRALPLLAYPAAALTGASVYGLTHDARLQAEGIAAVAARTEAAAAVTVMDLSVEAEAFGCRVSAPEHEVPTVIGALLEDEEAARALRVPEVGACRTGLYPEAVQLVRERITDRPLLAGIIGPFSLAGRLMGVSEAMMNCLIEPDMVRITLEKATEFLKAYARAFREAGADGVIIAEPLAGLLSPALEAEFSAPYLRQLIAAVRTEGFAVILHDCGPNTPLFCDSLRSLGADAYHFGDAVELPVMLERMGPDAIVLGNISPAREFVGGTPESMREAVRCLYEKAGRYPGFVLSSGCDLPPRSSWANIDAFFDAAREFSGARELL